MQRVILYPESSILRDFDLALLDIGVVELFNMAALYTYDVVVVPALFELENGFTDLEMVADEQPGLFELRQHAINRCKA
ncbi:MAG: hypothetical protein JWN13_5436 [Betaproteobacteria bacterium]|nr:hypothetical protein [Betaproteobacteria bacterium]